MIEFMIWFSATLIGSFIGFLLGLGILDFISLIRGDK